MIRFITAQIFVYGLFMSPSSPILVSASPGEKEAKAAQLNYNPFYNETGIALSSNLMALQDQIDGI